VVKTGDLLSSKYRVERMLGEGGMGLVVEAYHELLDQRVAVKLLYQDVADSEAQSRLLLEARSLAKLKSEHVARVIDVDVGPDGLPFIVMELLEGVDLCQLADTRGALPPLLVVDYVLQVLEGLAHAHGRGIIHRDLKPSNLFLANQSDGVSIIKILDFGISKSQDSAQDRRTQQLTGGGSVLGSPPYMSPEQVRSPKSVDHRTDIWSLGICMYELLTNCMPFGGDELQETFAQILEKEPIPIRTLAPGISEGLEAVVMRCLAKNRDGRFANVAELASALAPFGTGLWEPSVERVRTTLALAMREEAHARGRSGGVSEHTTRASIPVRRLESIQPELHGTTRTVARRATVFGPNLSKAWVTACIVVPAVIGISLIAVSTFRRSNRVVATAEVAPPPPVRPAISVEPPPPTQTAAAIGSVPAPAATLLGVPPAMSSTPTKPSRLAPVATAVRAPAEMPSRIGSRPTASVATPSLPKGLPQTRSGE